MNREAFENGFNKAAGFYSDNYNWLNPLLGTAAGAGLGFGGGNLMGLSSSDAERAALIASLWGLGGGLVGNYGINARSVDRSAAKSQADVISYLINRADKENKLSPEEKNKKRHYAFELMTLEPRPGISDHMGLFINSGKTMSDREYLNRWLPTYIYPTQSKINKQNYEQRSV